MTKLRALIVEDSPVVLENLTETLEEMAGVEVVATAANEPGALAWMDSRSDGCDVVIIDIFLKSGSGIGVLKRLRDFAPPPDRVVLTNYATQEMRTRCLELGAEAVFDKSSEIDELVSWLADHPRKDPH
jgi:DNA-binding NarL/FixJ family response regulator